MRRVTLMASLVAVAASAGVGEWLPFSILTPAVAQAPAEPEMPPTVEPSPPPAEPPPVDFAPAPAPLLRHTGPTTPPPLPSSYLPRSSSLRNRVNSGPCSGSCPRIGSP